MDDPVDGLTPPFALAAVGVQAGDGLPRFHIATAPGLIATERTMFRTASISKIVTGQTLAAVAGGELGRDVGAVLGFALRNPGYPDLPITLAHVLSHTSGLTDAAGYLIPPGVRLGDWIAETGPACFTARAPGTCANYSNLGYLLVAAAAEALSGTRFDTLAAEHVLRPLGITGGFNWSGVSAADRQDRIATYRRQNGALIAQIDGTVPETGISDPAGQEANVVDYHIGQSTVMFSPQGGLRLSLAGCLRLAQSLKFMNQIVLWAGEAGASPVFDHYGAGLQIFRKPHFYPRPLIGHFANAYGFVGGVWYDAERDVAFCYGLNGIEMDDTSDDLRPEELAIFDAIAHSGG